MLLEEDFGDSQNFWLLLIFTNLAQLSNLASIGHDGRVLKFIVKLVFETNIGVVLTYSLHELPGLLRWFLASIVFSLE